MSSEFEQASRESTDGPISVWRADHHGGQGPDRICIAHEGTREACNGGGLTLSEYNAARILVCLAQVLGVRLNREDAKRIKL